MKSTRFSSLFPSALILFFSVGMHLSCAQAEHDTVKPADDPQIQSAQLESLGLMRPSFYWVAVEKKEAAKKTKKLFDKNGNLLAAVTPKYHKELTMEGTGKLLNKKIINYESRRLNPDGTTEILWQFCPPEAPYGYGLGTIPLVPFRSVATDLSVIPLGSKVFIPAAVGVKLPDGSVHDGYFTAVDIGDMIKNKKIDIFTAYGDQSDVFEKGGMQTGKMIEVFLVK